MSATLHLRRLALFVCLVALVLAALTPAAVGLPLTILVAFWFFIALVIAFAPPDVDEQNYPQQALVLLAFSPRPPPAL